MKEYLMSLKPCVYTEVRQSPIFITGGKSEKNESAIECLLNSK